jgi:CHAT domain-containing protein
MARTRATAGGQFETQAQHVLALLDLAWADLQGKAVDRTISFLRREARLSDRPALLLADLAAAHLLRAERTQSPRDLLEAMETASQALEADSLNLAARWNLALALDLNGLDSQAERAWQDYLRLDGTSGWAAEAQERIRALALRPAPTLPPSADDSAGVARFADQAPQQALMMAWDNLLGEWGDAVMQGDSVREEERLRYVRIAGGTLVRRGRDATLLDQVGVIAAAAGDGGARRRLARAHGEYARARADLVASRRDAARAGFARVLRDAPTGSPLHRWATLYAGLSRMYQNPRAGEPILRRIAEHTDTSRYPVLAGRARSMLGSSLLRQGRYQEAAVAYGHAARLLAKAGEDEHAGAALGFGGTAEHHRGNPAGAYASLHAALMALRPHRASTWLHTALWAQADAAAGDGYLRATAHILDEDVVIAAATGDPADAAEARTTRARLLLASGYSGQPLEEVRREVVRAVERVEEEQGRRWFRAELWDVEAALTRPTAPEKAAAVLDSAVAFWTAQENVLRLLPPLLARAEARLAAGRTADARSDLHGALSLLALERGSLASSREREPVLRAVADVAGRLALRSIESGDARGGLQVVSLARAADRPAALAPAQAPGTRVRAPQGATTVVHALVSDTLVVWVVRDTTVYAGRHRVNRPALLAAAEHARARLEQPHRAGAADALPALRTLYDVLMRPVAHRLGEAETPLLFLPDPALEAVPFAALLDARRGRFLVEDHSVAVALSLEHAPRARRPAAGPALLVAATAFDQRLLPELEPLPGAAAEVEELRGLYRGAEVLTDSQAVPRAVLAGLRHATVVHFAGHAVFDDQHPERSRLVLAGRTVSGDAAQLTASELEAAKMAPEALVVLSACQTVRAPSGRSGGFASLAGAFLAAGAGGVVGSLWRVNDASTGALMTAFHQEYQRERNGAAALRRAQIRMLRSRDPHLASPAAWAGFRYTGN